MSTILQKDISSHNYKIPFFILLFVCFASAILGDSVAEALLLSSFPASVIPRMYLVNALFLFISAIFLMSFIDRIDRGLFFILFLLFHSFILFVIWLSINIGLTFLFVPLFSYAYVTKILLFLLFWTLANDIIDSRRASNEFPFIAAGGTLGAIGVSFLIPGLMRIVSAQSLLLLWALLTAIIILIFIPFRKSFGSSFRDITDSEKHAKRSLKKLIKDIALLKNEPLLANMSMLYFFLFFLLLNQQFSFYGAIKSRFISAEKIASFIGYFNGVSMAVTFILQLTLSGYLLKKIGSTRSMFLLPAILALVYGTLSVMAFFQHGNGDISAMTSLLFWGLMVGVGLRIAFFDSFFSPNFQIFFSGFPHDIRGRSKLLIEGIVKPSAMVIASVWLINVTSKISLSINLLVLFFISITMIILTIRIRNNYALSLSYYLGGFQNRVAGSILNIEKNGSNKKLLAYIQKMLKTDSYDIRCYLIELLFDMQSDESLSILLDCLIKLDSKTKALIISVVTPLKHEIFRDAIIGLLDDDNIDVVANAIIALAGYNDPKIFERLRIFLEHKNSSIKANTIVALWPVADSIFRKKLIGLLDLMLNSDKQDVDSVISVLSAIGNIRSSLNMSPLLESFIKDFKSSVFLNNTIWNKFLVAVSNNPSQKLFEELIDSKSVFHRKKRNDIAVAFASACNQGFSLEKIIYYLRFKNSIYRTIVLDMMTVIDQKVTITIENDIVKIAKEENQLAFEDWNAFMQLKKNSTNKALQLLADAIFEESIADHLFNLIHIAAILDKTGYIKTIKRRLNHENRHVRGRALEVLDNIGNIYVNHMLIDLIEVIYGEESAVKHIFTKKYTDIEIINSYISDENKWVSECAEYAIVHLESKT